jgi:acetyl-CoA carboxylase carboxyltransferase component
MSIQDQLDDLRRRKEQAALGGGQRRIDAQHQRGKLTARERIELLVDHGTFEELDSLVMHRANDFGIDQQRFPGDSVVTGFARIEGQVVGIVANQPKWKGGVLFVDSADKAARFVCLCDAFGIPLVFLADVPGFMIGKAVERMGIIRHGAKMISAIADATVPKLCVVVRKAYGAGLYAMSGPAFDADATIALPQAMIAVMGAEAAVNAVFANKISARPEAERPDYIEHLRQEYREDIDIVKLAANLHVDAIVQGDDLRGELARRLSVLVTKTDAGYARRRPVTPV